MCMKQNNFYVQSIIDFKNLRYKYKFQAKKYKMLFEQERDPRARQELEYQANLYESLQVAYKSILNSFYGYVMRKGSRWYSMEMAAMVTNTGATII